jgi:hypothetical protein
MSIALRDACSIEVITSMDVWWRKYWKIHHGPPFSAFLGCVGQLFTLRNPRNIHRSGIMFTARPYSCSAHHEPVAAFSIDTKLVPNSSTCRRMERAPRYNRYDDELRWLAMSVGPEEPSVTVRSQFVRSAISMAWIAIIAPWQSPLSQGEDTRIREFGYD